MLRIKEAIVVEGRYDKNTLSQVVDTLILETGGFHIFKDPEQMALTLNGKKKNIRKKDLLALAESCGISSAAALKLIRSITARQDSYLALCRESWLPEDMKTGLAELICQRMAVMQ